MRFLVWLDDKHTTQIGYADVGCSPRGTASVTDPNVVRLAAEADKLANIVTGTAA